MRQYAARDIHFINLCMPPPLFGPLLRLWQRYIPVKLEGSLLTQQCRRTLLIIDSIEWEPLPERRALTKGGYLWVRAMVFNTTFNDISIISWWGAQGEVYSMQHHVIKFVSYLRKVDWWFSPGTPVSSINNTDHHDIIEISLKVVLNTINFITWCCIEYTSPWAPLPRGWGVERLLIYHILNGLVAILNRLIPTVVNTLRHSLWLMVPFARISPYQKSVFYLGRFTGARGTELPPPLC
jgi:hypothetical protein